MRGENVLRRRFRELRRIKVFCRDAAFYSAFECVRELERPIRTTFDADDVGNERRNESESSLLRNVC